MIETKICSKCHIEKILIRFSRNKTSKNGFNGWCKDCNNKYRKEHKEEAKRYKKIYYKKNKEKLLIYGKQWRKNNKKKVQKLKRNWKLNHKKEQREYKRKYEKRRRKEDSTYNLLSNLRSRICAVLKQNQKSAKTEKLIGCSVEKLKQHLQKQFKKGMTWKNYGEWHIDHKIPCIAFDLSKSNKQSQCFNYKNLQPLWAKENRKKGDRMETKKRKRIKKKLPNKRKRKRSKKVIKRIGVFIPIQADITTQQAKLDRYIVEQGCQRLGTFHKNIDKEKGVIELYARTRYVGKVKAKKVKPITGDSLQAELAQMAEQAKTELIFPQT